jgi:hypothetical protein
MSKCSLDVIARSASDEAIQSAPAALDCFAALAMTEKIFASVIPGRVVDANYDVQSHIGESRISISPLHL